MRTIAILCVNQTLCKTAVCPKICDGCSPVFGISDQLLRARENIKVYIIDYPLLSYHQAHLFRTNTKTINGRKLDDNDP